MSVKMSFQTRFMSMLDTILRVPLLFYLDETIKHTMGVSKEIEDSSSSPRLSRLLNETDAYLNATYYQSFFSEKYFDSSSLSTDTDDATNWLGNILSSCNYLGKLLLPIFLFLLNSHRLLRFYMLLGSLVITLMSFHGNLFVVDVMSKMNTSQLVYRNGEFGVMGANYICQGFLGFLFNVFYSGIEYPYIKYLVTVSFLLPASCFFLIPFSSVVHVNISVFAALFPLAIIVYFIVTNFMLIGDIFDEGCNYAISVVQNFGLHALIESEWIRLNVPNVLRTFWLIRIAQHIIVLHENPTYIHTDCQSFWSLNLYCLFYVVKALLTQGCETSVALLGMTSIVSYISHYIGTLFQMILLTDDDERSLGTVCAILFFVLAEQSGLTVLEGEKRFIRLCRNFSLLFTAIAHFVHNMVHPVLMSLSASFNPALYRHLRALGVCLFLIISPATFLISAWSVCSFSTWLLAVSTFSVQVIIKTVVSLLLYILFLIESYCSTFWERFDDYVYYVKAFGNSVEFIFGILLFFNGAWIFFFESGSAIRAVMICIHAYFNIWCEAKNGWNIFMKRCSAVKKINSLPEATIAELTTHDDVCAICFQELQTAKITKCNHYFHSVCLRKWLYMQDLCPLCHKIFIQA